MTSGLRSPTNGQPLHRVGPYALCDEDGQWWPVIDGIAYLRAGSRACATAALDHLDRSDREEALLVLLAENGPGSENALPDEDSLRHLIRNVGTISLREAMDRLAYGEAGTRLAHRWSDPSFVAGLALLNSHWTEPRSAFELGCGIGQDLRELHRVGTLCTGADTVFSRLWLARHFVVGADVELVCMDGEAQWPLADHRRWDLAFCLDPFFLLRDRAAVLEPLRAISASGVLAIGNLPNRDRPDHSVEAAMTLAEIEALFPAARLYAEEDLTESLLKARPPQERANDLSLTEAFSIVEGYDGPSAEALGPLGTVADGTTLRRNPMIDEDGSVHWPSERYEAEYARRITYGGRPVPERAEMTRDLVDAVRRRDLLDLPERW